MPGPALPGWRKYSEMWKSKGVAPLPRQEPTQDALFRQAQLDRA